MGIYKKFYRYRFALIILIFSIVNILLFTSRGTVDARNWEVIFADIVARGSRFVPDCLSYMCPSNLILTKFPPGHALIFYLFSFIFPVRFFGTMISMKALIAFFYILTYCAYMYFVKVVGANKKPFLAHSALFLSLVSVILSAQGLAYTDIVTFPFFILSLLAIVRKKYIWSGVLFSLSFLIKWQSVIILPIILVYVISGDLKRRVSSLVEFCVGMFISVLMFIPVTHNIFTDLLLSLRNSLTHTATFALNVQWVIQNIPISGLALHVNETPSATRVALQLGVFVLGYLMVIKKVLQSGVGKNRDEYFFHALLLGLGMYYLFSFGVHENHFILGTIIALLLYARYPTKVNRVVLLMVDGINTLNMVVFYGFTGSPIFHAHVLGFDASVMIACVISIGSLYYAWRMLITTEVKKY